MLNVAKCPIFISIEQTLHYKVAIESYNQRESKYNWRDVFYALSYRDGRLSRFDCRSNKAI